MDIADRSASPPADGHAAPYFAWLAARQRLEQLLPGSQGWQDAARAAHDAWCAMVAAGPPAHGLHSGDGTASVRSAGCGGGATRIRCVSATSSR